MSELTIWKKPDGTELFLNNEPATIAEAMQLGWECSNEDISPPPEDEEDDEEDISGQRKTEIELAVYKKDITEKIKLWYGKELDSKNKISELKYQAFKIIEEHHGDS